MDGFQWTNGFQSWAWKVYRDLQLYQDQKKNNIDLILHFWEAPTRKDGDKMQMIKKCLSDGYVLA